MPVFGDATSIRFNGNSATKAFLNNNQIWPTTSTLVTENLLLHYNTFNTASYNGSGATITDLSGNSRNGTITGSPTWTGNYFTFVDDYITTPNLSSLITSLNETHSVELWVYPTNNGVLVQYNNSTSPNTSYHASSIEIVGGNLEVGFWNGSGLSSTGNIGAVSFNEWHQIVLTYNGSVCKGYIDGVFKGSVNVSWSSPMDASQPFYMNSGASTATSHGDGTNFDGRFGIMRVYNKALTDAEVLSNYNSTLSTLPNLTTSGLVFNLQAAPSSGTTWVDASGNGYNATLQGSPTYVSNNGGGIRLNNPTYTGTDFISVPYNIGSTTTTIEIVASFNATTYWAAIWANEAYTTSKGYFAYQSSATNIAWGSPSSNTINSTITASNAIRHWIFVINGTSKSLYLNGTQLGTTQTVANPAEYATGNFYFGSRHGNDGTGNTDRLNNSTAANYPVFYQMRLYNKALSGAEITQNYNIIKSTYGL